MARPLQARALPLALVALLAAAAVFAGGARLAALAQGAAATAQDVATDDDAVTFRHLTTDQGLRSEAVADVTQDALGFIWIATNEGLARYDGVDVVSYRRTADSTSLSGNVVQVVEPGPMGVVWAGTRTGLSRYDPARDAFVRVHGLPSDDVLALEADSAGGAWVGTAAGLAHVTASGAVDGVDRPSASDMGSLPAGTVEDLLLDRAGTLWVGTDDGLARREAGSDRFDTFRPNPDSVTVLDGFRVQALATTQRGAILVATFGSGLLAFDPRTERFTPVAIERGGGAQSDVIAQNVMDALEDGDGTVWAATLGGGLRRVTSGVAEPRVYTSAADDAGSIADDQVSALFEDRQGILWVGTYSGLDRFDRARSTALRLRHDPEVPSSIASNTVRAVLRTEDALYVGTDVGLDVSADGRAFRHAEITDRDDLGDQPVRVLYRDPEGTVWVGTEGAGLHRVGTAGQVERVPFRSGTAADPGITALLADGGRLWVGTLANGLARFDPETKRAEFFQHDPQRPASLASDQVRALATDAAGDLWVGTSEGLCHLNSPRGGGTFTCFTAREGDPSALGSPLVHALHGRSDGSLWVGTGVGFYRLDTRSPDTGFTRYDPDTSDLPGEAVYAIVEDESGFLWLTTNGGLTRFEPLTETFYQRLGSSDAERSLNGAAARAPDGQLLFGSTRGLLAFNPQQLAVLNANPPQVAITRVDVAGEAVVPGESDVLATAATVAERIDLDHDAAFLTIHYAGLHFSDPAANTYRFRLVGLYDEWRDVGTTREATFSSLPPGRYTFEVQAANADGVGFKDEGEAGFDAATKQIQVVVHPPLWRTWWALLIFAALAVLAVIRVDRWQRERLLRQERERAERREAELRAETAEAEQRKATAEAAMLKAENDRKAAELEQAREVEAANTKLAAANGQLEASLRDLRATQAQLVQSEKLASLGQLTAGIAHEIKNPLNFVNNFADLSVELADDLRKDLSADPTRPVGEVAEEVADLLDDLQENARRIREHGQRADRIVRSMLLHSRGGSSERGRVDLNRFIDEYANLAFHGARANDSDFQVDVVRDFDEAAGEVEIVPQEFGRVLINLLTNAFHAVAARGRTASDGYHPTVTVRTRREGGEVAVEVEDNGTGIPAAVKAKIFEPFFTTKPTGEGTGLGLSLAHDIVTQVHGGRMDVESTEGEGTTFEVVLPAAGPAPPVDGSGDGVGEPLSTPTRPAGGP